MSDTLTLLYILVLPCIYYAYVTFSFNYYFVLITFSGKNCAPTLFVTELHNYGCADITSLNEMLTCSWDKHTHVFSSQLAPSIRFYILWNKKKKISCIDQHFLAFCHITFRKSKLNIFICHTSSSRNNSKYVWSLINYFQIKEIIFIFLSEVYIS